MLSAVIVPRPRPRPVGARARSLAPFAAAVAAHMVAGVLLHQNRTLATAHAVLSIAGAVAIAALSPWVETIAGAAAYLCGAELLWRVTGASVFLGAGKYAVILVLGIGLLRLGGGGRGKVALPLGYLLALLPSTVLTLEQFGLVGAREQLSFNLSGPATLAVCVMFFTRARTDWRGVQAVLWAMVAPIAGIASVAAWSTFTAERIEFGRSSNFVTSGGFGPNQISAVLGLGALLALVLALRETGAVRRALAFALGIWMLAQSVLTFSRGGLVNVIVAVLLGGVYALREPRRLAGLLVPMALVVVFSGLVVYPRLVGITGGLLQVRFTDLTFDERELLLQADLRAFREHPLGGVGPGVGTLYRQLPDGRPVAAHTEFTRLLAEHGTGGVVAIGLLLAMVVRAYRKAGTRFNRAWTVALAGWSLTEMSHGAMRFAAIAMVFGLMHWRIAEEEPAGPGGAVPGGAVRGVAIPGVGGP